MLNVFFFLLLLLNFSKKNIGRCISYTEAEEKVSQINGNAGVWIHMLFNVFMFIVSGTLFGWKVTIKIFKIKYKIRYA